jgi:hypothetical protein
MLLRKKKQLTSVISFCKHDINSVGSVAHLALVCEMIVIKTEPIIVNTPGCCNIEQGRVSLSVA